MNYRDPSFLRDHIDSILSFYYPVCIDEAFGGYINQLRDDGSVYDRMTKHLVGTCRFVHNFAIGFLVLRRNEYRDAALHGIRFLMDYHRQTDGGFAWVLHGREVQDAYSALLRARLRVAGGCRGGKGWTG